MSQSSNEHEKEKTLLDIYLKEYERLKEEQLKRITFRDVTIPLSMFAVIGSVATAVTGANPLSYYSLLISPCVCFVLGWIYLVNDEKVGAIGKYVRGTLKDRLMVLSGSKSDEPLFKWEVVHRSDPRRKSRKWFQLLADEITFVFSGFVALWVFRVLVPISDWSLQTTLFWYVELFLLVLIGYWIIVYSGIYADLFGSNSSE